MAEYFDPYRSYNFKLVIQGITEGHFTEVSDLSVNVEAIKYREGGNNQVVHNLPGRVDYGEVTLRYGLSKDAQLFEWIMSAVKGKVERKNVSILMLDTEGTAEVMRWDMINAWAREWRGAKLDALGQEIAIESLTLVFDELTRG